MGCLWGACVGEYITTTTAPPPPAWHSRPSPACVRQLVCECCLPLLLPAGLTGTLPDVISTFSCLNLLDVSRNRLQGRLPLLCSQVGPGRVESTREWDALSNDTRPVLYWLVEHSHG